LRQAAEAKALIKDELGEGNKGSTIRDVAEILKSLPGVLQSLGSLNPQALQQLQENPQLVQRHVSQITQPPKRIQATEQGLEPPDFTSVKLEKLMAMLELEPEQAWQRLHDEGDHGWISYLKANSYEQLVEALNGISEAAPQFKENIDGFLKQHHTWLQNLILIAHRNEAKSL